VKQAACISTTGKKHTKNASTAPNIQNHCVPEIPLEPTTLLYLAAENVVVTAGAE